MTTKDIIIEKLKILIYSLESNSLQVEGVSPNFTMDYSCAEYNLNTLIENVQINIKVKNG